MSKIGKSVIKVPEDVKVEISGRKVAVTGPKGNLDINLSREVNIKNENGVLSFSIPGNDKLSRSIWGTSRMLVFNMIKGVTQGWSKQLELVGTGYRAEVAGETLILTVGYSHPIKIEAPRDVTFKVEKNIITVTGLDKQIVGQIAANIRASRPPEPYKGKGIKYVDEIIRRKAGKAAKVAGATQ